MRIDERKRQPLRRGGWDNVNVRRRVRGALGPNTSAGNLQCSVVFSAAQGSILLPTQCAECVCSLCTCGMNPLPVLVISIVLLVCKSLHVR